MRHDGKMNKSTKGVFSSSEPSGPSNTSNSLLASTKLIRIVTFMKVGEEPRKNKNQLLLCRSHCFFRRLLPPNGEDTNIKSADSTDALQRQAVQPGQCCTCRFIPFGQGLIELQIWIFLSTQQLRAMD